MHRLRLLHISDIHSRGSRETEAWRRRRVLGDGFWRNLDDLQSDGAFDLICFTGDLGDWGQPDEDATVGTFLSELLERSGLAITLPGSIRDHLARVVTLPYRRAPRF